MRLPLGAMMTSLGVDADSALMLSRRGRNFGGVFGGGVSRRFTSMTTGSARAPRTAMRPTSNGQTLTLAVPFSMRTCERSCSMSDKVGAESAGDGAVNVLDLAA